MTGINNIVNKKNLHNITAQDFKARFSGRNPGIQGAGGEFAVVVPIVDINGEAHILYELRSNYIDRQPGEVCFPGGEIEAGETPLQGAVRETWEEIGIKEPDLEIISQLDIYHPPTGIVLYPFLAQIKEEALSRLKLSECEVAQCFTVPVSFFEHKPYEYKHFADYNIGDDFDYSKVGLTKPTYNWRPIEHRIISWEYDGKFIWGMTALITEWMLKILLGD